MITKQNGKISGETLVNQVKSGTVIDGDIKSNGDIRIDGTLTGTLDAQGRVVIGPTGVINGDIVCQNAEIMGSVKGTISVSELLSLKASAKINGDIVTGKLSIEPGASFSGACSMGGIIKDIHDNAESGQDRARAKEKAAAY